MLQPTQAAAGGPSRSRAAGHSRTLDQLRTGSPPW
jgi:hypothetical protein